MPNELDELLAQGAKPRKAPAAKLSSVPKLPAPTPTAGAAPPAPQSVGPAGPLLPPPVTSVLAKASNLLETPFTLLGAAGIDQAENRHGGKETALGHALSDMGHGKFGDAANQYSVTSWPYIKRIAGSKSDDWETEHVEKPLSQWELKHPRITSAAQGVSEFANPASGAIGRLAGAGMKLGKAGLTAGGKAAAKVARAASADPVATVSDPMHRAAQSAGEAAGGARMADLRQAAAEEAPKRGVHPKVAADRADIIGRQMVMAGGTARAQMQPVVKEVFGGLSPAQKNDLVDAIEGTSKGASIPDAARRVAAYRKWRAQIDARTMKNGLAQPGEMFNGPKYFPRRGMTMNPAHEGSEELGDQEEELAARRSRGGANIRRDTLSQTIPPRKYETRQQAIISGRVALNPKWDPADAMYQHGVTRVRNNVLQEGASQLGDLGLVVPKTTKDTWLKDVPHRPDYLPFTDIGTTRQFGSPTLKESAVHPSVANLIEDLGSQASSGGLSSPLDIVTGGLTAANRAASKTLVSQPGYHLPVNVIPNALASFAAHGVDVPALLKAVVKPKAAMKEAQAAGADFPYHDPGFKTKDLEPWSSLTGKERVGRVAGMPGKAVNKVSSELLYKHMQPPVAAAAFKGLQKPMGGPAAALETRSIVGEEENLGARERQAAQAFMFPSWLKSQSYRRWPKMLAKHPQLYMAPHTAVNQANRSKGVSPDPYGYGSLVPPIVTDVDKKTGRITEVPIPGPANRVTSMVDALGNIAQGTGDWKTVAGEVLNMLNPAIGAAGHFVTTQFQPPGEPSSTRLYDKDAPKDVKMRQGAGSLVGRFTPLRSSSATRYAPQPSSLVGLEPEQQLTPKERKLEYKIENAFRQGIWNRGPAQPGIESFRAWAKKARQNGGSITIGGQRFTAEQLDRHADRMWVKMQAILKKQGLAS